jgi:hypothetical protein
MRSRRRIRISLTSAVTPASTVEIVEMISISSFANSFIMRRFNQVNAGNLHQLRSTACAAVSRAAAMVSAAA